MLLHQRHDGIDALPAVLHVDGVDDPATGDVLECSLDHIRLGRIDHQRRLHTHREQLHHLRHLLRFISALGKSDADVEHVRARVYLLARDLEDSLVIVGQQQSLHLARALRIDALAHQERRRVLVQGDGAHSGAHTRDVLRVIDGLRCSLRLANRSDDRREMLRSRTAASTDNADTEVLHELRECGRHRSWLERIHRLADPGIERQTRIGNHRQRKRRVLGQIPHRLAHVLRTRRAVQADHIDAERLERRHRARDVGPQEHAPAHVERNLRLQREPPSDLDEQSLDARDRRLHFEDVLRRLDQKQIDSALDQVLRLLVEVVCQLGIRNLRQHGIGAGRQHPRRAHRSRHKPRLIRCRVFVSSCPRQSRGTNVYLANLVAQPPLPETAGRRLERARLHDIASHRQERLMNGLDHVGARENEIVVATLQRLAAKVLSGKVVPLDVRPHRAVVYQHSAL